MVNVQIFLNVFLNYGVVHEFLIKSCLFSDFPGSKTSKIANFFSSGFLKVQVAKSVLKNNAGLREGGVFFVLLVFLNFDSISAPQDFQALVIGNQRYQQVPLDTPEADAKAMASRLELAGYSVTRLLNAKRSQTYDAIDEFFARSQHAKVLVFFYAGHAAQLNGRNFIVPVDLANRDDPDVLSKMFDLRYLMNKLTESKAETKIVILDSCRDNIFSSHPGAASGLSELIAPAGTFVAFSTAPGSTAEDGDGANSPYTTALLDTLFRPGVKIEEAFKEVRRRVRLMTGNEQTPWESTSLVHDFYMVNPRSAGGARRTKPQKNLSQEAQSSIAAMAPASQSKPDRSACARILAKLSIGMMPLSHSEADALANCRQ